MIRALALLLLCSPPPFSDYTRDIVRKQPRFKAPAAGVKAIADFQHQSGNYEQALGLYRFALVHKPDDPTLAERVRELEQLVASRQASAASPSPAPAPSASPASPSPGAAPPSPSPKPPAPKPAAKPAAKPPAKGDKGAASATPAPPPPPPPERKPSTTAADQPYLTKLAKVLGIPADPSFLDGAQRDQLPGLERERKLQALAILKTLDAAGRLVMAKEPKRDPKTLDLPALKAAGALPDDFEISPDFPIIWQEGQPMVNGLPPLADLEGELADYRQALASITRTIADNLRGQALHIAGEVNAAFPDDPEVLTRKLDLELSLKLDPQALETATNLARLKPVDPTVLHHLDLLLYRNGEDDRARDLALLIEERWASSFHATLARAIRSLVESPIDPKLMEAPGPAPASPSPTPASPASGS